MPIFVKTGLSNEEMADFKNEMNDLYKNNYGESLEDIADAFASVSQNSKETDPSKIKELTKNALILRDSFGYELPETMRAVNMLIDQFGVTGEEAFNLIAQGTQNGLNKNEDLLDTINEYGVHYHNAGYSAEEFFNSLKNGTDAGTFSVDKLGDAMKEFGIKAKEGGDETVTAWATLGLVQGDNSEKIQETAEKISEQKSKIADLEKKLKYAYIEQGNFNEKTDELKKMKMADNISEWENELSELKNGLSLNEQGLKDMQNAGSDTKYTVSELMSAFNEGGDKAKEATQDVMKALFSLDDETQRNALGVQLFGTMWEDLQAEGVKALTQIDGEFDKTADTMKEIDSIKYDDIGSALGNLGRTIETEIIQPIVEKIVPPIKDFIGWLIENIPIVEGAFAGLGTAMATMFVSKQIMAVVNSWKAYKTATEGATIAQWLLNAAQNSNPMMLLISIIAGLVAAFVVLWNKSDAFRNFWMGLWEEIQNTLYNFFDMFVLGWNTIKDFLSEVWKNFQKSFQAGMDTIINFLSDLWENIKSIFKPVADWFKEKFTNARNEIKNAFSQIGGWFTDRWNDVKNVFSSVGDFFSEKFTGGWNKIKDAFSKSGSFFFDLWEEIKRPFLHVADWFRDTFSEAWQNVKDVFSTDGHIFEGIKEGISGVFTTVVNGIIRGINNVIEIPFDAINSALRKIRDVSIAGVEPFADKIHEIDVPHIPELAQGGVLRKGKWGFLEGDGDEAVVPLEKNTRWIDEVASKISNSMPNSVSGTQGNVNSTTNYNFYQTNNSPKALTRLEIYRQSRNLLNAKGV